MKSFLKSLICLLVAVSGANAQTIPVQLPAGIVYEYRLNYKIDSLARALKAEFGTVVIIPPIIKPPVVVKDSCVKGPTIEGISKITSTGAVLNFDALGVNSIDYQVLSETGTILYSDSLIGLSSSTVTFRYSAF